MGYPREFKWFNIDEFKCKETGENNIQPEFVRRLGDLRDLCGFPFIITSGYRSPSHSKEREKVAPGQHTEGHAADIAVNGGVQRRMLVECALSMNFTGIGVARGYVHVDMRQGTPVLWTYG